MAITWYVCYETKLELSIIYQNLIEEGAKKKKDFMMSVLPVKRITNENKTSAFLSSWWYGRKQPY